MNRKISVTLRSSIENVLKRWAIPYRIIEKDGNLFIDSSLSGAEFHRVVLRAKMEKETEESNSSIPFVAKSELEDFQIMDEIGECYIIQN